MTSLFVLFGQRPGEYTPEAVEVIDEYSQEESPEWLVLKLKEEQKKDVWSSLAIIEITIDYARVIKILDTTPQNIEGRIDG